MSFTSLVVTGSLLFLVGTIAGLTASRSVDREAVARASIAARHDADRREERVRSDMEHRLELLAQRLGSQLDERTAETERRVNDVAAAASGSESRLRSEWTRALHDVRRSLSEVQATHAQHASRKDVEALQAAIVRPTRMMERLTEEVEARSRILDTYVRGVGLVHAAFTLLVDGPDGPVPVPGANGQPFRIDTLGSAFLASADGDVVTNRHVAQPWWQNDKVAHLVARGLEPSHLELTVTFPGQEPIVVDPATIRVSDDEIDLAVFRVEVTGVPVLPLAPDDIRAARGERIVLLGYPTGLGALLARAPRDGARSVMGEASDMKSAIRAMARQGMVSPIITQGALNEIAGRKLVYDAPTTVGGSGGPVFGPDGTVVGVNYAITRDFDGSNLGVRVEYVRALLEASERSRTFARVTR